MDKIEPRSQSPNKTPNTLLRPILNNWSINRRLEKLEQDYRTDQERKPAEIKLSSIANPAGAAIFYRVERLRQYVEEREGIYDADIKAGHSTHKMSTDSGSDDPFDKDHSRKRSILRQAHVKVDAPYHPEYAPHEQINPQKKKRPMRETNVTLPAGTAAEGD
jgi:hypothetical protein